MPSDLVERLRASVTQCRAVDRSELLEEAAAEIERSRLRDTEREAMEYFSQWVEWRAAKSHAVTLRGLLERTK
jgi:hypothetical protein